MKKIGYKRWPNWTPKEIFFVKDNHLKMTNKELGAALGRTPSAVKTIVFKRVWEELPGYNELVVQKELMEKISGLVRLNQLVHNGSSGLTIGQHRDKVVQNIKDEVKFLKLKQYGDIINGD